MEQLHLPDTFLYTAVREKKLNHLLNSFLFYFFLIWCNIILLLVSLAFYLLLKILKFQSLRQIFCCYFADDSSSKVDVKEAFEAEAGTL